MTQQNFKEWLIKIDNKKESTADNYSKAINNISKHYSKETKQEIDIYKIEDLNKLISIREKYGLNGEYFEFGNNSNGTNRASINCFYKFIREQKVKAIGNINDIWNIIDEFKFTRKEYPKTKDLQIGLLKYLSKNVGEFNWQEEFSPIEEYKDKVDIFGINETGFKIVIELDTNRADQVAKKFVSRLALFRDDEILYIALCYPPKSSKELKKESSKNQVRKYFKYCESIIECFNENSKSKKYFKAKIL